VVSCVSIFVVSSMGAELTPAKPDGVNPDMGGQELRSFAAHPSTAPTLPLTFGGPWDTILFGK